MQPQHSTRYTVGFAGAICVVCSVLVSSSAVLLADRQAENAILDRQKKVLDVAGLLPSDPAAALGRAAVQRTFAERIRPRVVDMGSGDFVSDVDPASFDPEAVMADPNTSRVAPANAAQVKRIPEQALIYEVVTDGQVGTVILPVEGKGLWSTLYGFLALDTDGVTVKGLTFYQHAETPGLGGEIDNPRWKAKWVGRRAFDAQLQPALQVIKGAAGSPESDPHQVDGLSGATLTGRGVTALLEFWLGQDGFAPFLDKLRKRQGV